MNIHIQDLNDLNIQPLFLQTCGRVVLPYTISFENIQYQVQFWFRVDKVMKCFVIRYVEMEYVRQLEGMNLVAITLWEVNFS